MPRKQGTQTLIRSQRVSPRYPEQNRGLASLCNILLMAARLWNFPQQYRLNGSAARSQKIVKGLQRLIANDTVWRRVVWSQCRD